MQKEGFTSDGELLENDCSGLGGRGEDGMGQSENIGGILILVL